MPNLDGTGPNGQGSRTGRGMGPCSSMGKGCCNWGGGCFFQRFFSSKDELSVLEDEEKNLEERLSIIRQKKATLINTKK
jgi:hypothetical protein